MAVGHGEEAPVGVLEYRRAAEGPTGGRANPGHEAYSFTITAMGNPAPFARATFYIYISIPYVCSSRTRHVVGLVVVKLAIGIAVIARTANRMVLAASALSLRARRI